jgi:hypothetical protein
MLFLETKSTSAFISTKMPTFFFECENHMIASFEKQRRTRHSCTFCRTWIVNEGSIENRFWQFVNASTKIKLVLNMKPALCLLILIITSLSLFSQGRCKLDLVDGKLSGPCENSYFTSFDINLNDEVSDSSALFGQLPLSGTVTFNNKNTVELTCELTERAGFPQILLKTRSGWFTMDSLQVSSNNVTFYIDHDPEVPVTMMDLRIIRRAKDLLKDEKSWHKNDDRDCEDDIENKRYSLFCALQTASIEEEGAYNHRNAIMQKIRHTIVEIYPNKEWEHRLRDFNNMPETDFAVLIDLLNRVEKEVAGQLE